MVNLKLKKISECSNLRIMTLILSVFMVIAFNSTYAKSFKSFGSFRSSKSYRVSQPKSSKFLTGVVAGSLLFPHRSNSVSYESSYGNSYDDELFIEYERNSKLLLNNLPEEKRIKLDRRNLQIKNELIKAADAKYVASYSLELIPVEQKILEKTIEESTALTKLHDVLGINSTKNRQPADAERKQILYQLKLSSESPKPIEDFEVISVNGLKTVSDNPYFFNYSEKWGENLITVKLREKKEHALTLDLTTSYYIKNIKENTKNNIFDNFFEFYFWIFCLMIPIMLLNHLKG